MKSTLFKNIIFFFCHLLFLFFDCIGMHPNTPQLSTSPQDNTYWFNPMNAYNMYNRHYEISNGYRKFWVIGIPIGTNEHNTEFQQEKSKTDRIRANFEQKFPVETFSYLEEEDKKLTDKVCNRLGHIAATITFLCSRDTDLSNEVRLAHLEQIWQDYKDYISPIFVKKLNNEVIRIADLLHEQVQQVQTRFEGLEERNALIENITNDTDLAEE